MPRESFYNPDSTENEKPDFAYADAFAVEWAPDGNYSLPGNPDSEAVLVLAGVYMDESAVRRLQAVLRRALRKGKGHYNDIHWVLTTGDIVVQNPTDLEGNLARVAENAKRRAQHGL